MKVILVGCGGAGKTTIGKKLSNKLKVPIFNLDNYYWEPGWKKVEENEFREKIRRIIIQDTWIIDGMYSELFEELEKMNIKNFALVYIKVSKWRSIYRLIKRTLIRVLTKEEICNGNVESIRNLVGESSMIPYSIKVYEKKRIYCENLITNHKYGKVISSDVDIEDLLKIIRGYKLI